MTSWDWRREYANFAEKPSPDASRFFTPEMFERLLEVRPTLRP